MKTIELNEKNVTISAGIVITILAASFWIGFFVGSAMQKTDDIENRVKRIEEILRK